MPGGIVEFGDALNQCSQGRARIAEQDPEVAEADGAPCARHWVIEGAESRQPGEPEITSGHQGDAAVEGEPGRAAESMQSQEDQAENDDERGVEVIVFSGDWRAGKEDEMKRAFEDVEREDDEAEDGGGIAVAASFEGAPHPGPLPIGWREGDVALRPALLLRRNLGADVEIGDGQAKCDESKVRITEPWHE